MDLLIRKKVAALAKDLYEDKITYEVFLENIPENIEGDREVYELLDLIEHEPAKDGMFGVGDARHKEYMQEVWRLIKKLSNN